MSGTATIIDISGEIDALEREYAQRRAELDAIAASQRRAVEQSAWAAKKRAAEAATEAARVAKLDAWRNGALKQSIDEVNALGRRYDAWLTELKAWEAAGKALAEQQQAMGSEIITIETKLENATVSHDWQGAFENDEEMLKWLATELKNIPDLGLDAPIKVIFTTPRRTGLIMQTVHEKMMWVAGGKAKQYESFTEPAEQIRARRVRRQ